MDSLALDLLPGAPVHADMGALEGVAVPALLAPAVAGPVANEQPGQAHHLSLVNRLVSQLARIQVSQRFI
jgi:hypothetical protein